MLWLIHGVAIAQTGEKTKQQLKKEQANKKSRSFGAQRTEKEAIGAPPVNTNGSQNKQLQQSEGNNNQTESNSAAVEPKGNQYEGSDADAGNNPVNQQQAAENEKSNTPAVVQTTSSESGSPALLSPKNGKGRDGTNNVQRGGYNMAGAEEPGNMKLSNKNNSGRNINTGTRIRKQEDVPSRTNIRGTERRSLPSTENAAQPKENFQQDKNKNADSDGKMKRKQRRGKVKDTGK